MRVDLSSGLVTNLDERINELLNEELPTIFNKHGRRIGILGGTFNPPHLGHLMMAEQVGRQLELDEVWFMPTAKPPHAPGKITIAAQHRMKMVELAIADNPLFKLQPYEVYKGGKNYTIDTMRHFVKEYPETDFYFILGEDSVQDLPTWHCIDELNQLVRFVGIRRPGIVHEETPYSVMWVDSPLVELSSSEVRLRVYLEQSIRYQVPDAVADYIQQQNLYSMEMTN